MFNHIDTAILRRKFLHKRIKNDKSG